MTNPNYSEVIAIVDRSGSMAAIASDTEGGLNHFVEEQKKLPGEAKFTLVQFDDHYDVVHDAVDIKSVGNYRLHARGSTALLDAIGKTVTNVGERLDKLPEHERPGSVTVVILTDGYENASREWTSESIKKLITQQTDVYSWVFLYLGANQDAITEASKYGIGAGNSLTYTGKNVGVAYAAASNATTNYRSSVLYGASAAAASKTVNFSEEERTAAVR